jgi:hypothetical protein
VSCVPDCWRTPGHKGDCAVDMTAAELDAYLDFGPVQTDMLVSLAMRRWWKRRGSCSCGGVWWIYSCACQTGDALRGAS